MEIRNPYFRYSDYASNRSDMYRDEILELCLKLVNFCVDHVTYFYEIEKQRCIKIKNEIIIKILIIVSRWSLIALRCLKKAKITTFNGNNDLFS